MYHSPVDVANPRKRDLIFMVYRLPGPCALGYTFERKVESEDRTTVPTE